MKLEGIRSKKSAIAISLCYITISYIFLIKEIQFDEYAGIEYGIMFIIHTLSTSITLIGSYYVYLLLFKFIVDTNYDNKLELYNLITLINFVNFLGKYLIELLNNSLLSQVFEYNILYILGNFFIYVYYQQNYEYRKKSIIVYLVILLVISMITNILINLM